MKRNVNEQYLSKAKRKDNGEWIVGYYFEQQIHKDSPTKRYFIVVSEFPRYGAFSRPEFYEVDPSTICRCTGRHDCNGNLVWEHDIVEVHDLDKYLVVWDSQKAVFEFQVCECSMISFEHVGDEDMKVVGNKFDNLDLVRDLML